MKHRDRLKYKFYRLQQRLAITTREAQALWVLLTLLLLGILLGEYQKNQPAFTDEDYAEMDSLFMRATAQLKKRQSMGTADSTHIYSDSLMRDTHKSITSFFEPEFPININTATQEQLERLPRIGPRIARRIIDYREEHGAFRKPSDLREVSGIGVKTFDGLSDKITID